MSETKARTNNNFQLVHHHSSTKWLMDCKYLSGTERKKEHARTEQTRKMFMDMNRTVYISSVRLAE